MNNMRPLKQQVSITLDEDVIEKIKYIAESYDHSFSKFINIILKRYLKNREKHM